jgi:hypothetical protein
LSGDHRGVTRGLNNIHGRAPRAHPPRVSSQPRTGS